MQLGEVVLFMESKHGSRSRCNRNSMGSITQTTPEACIADTGGQAVLGPSHCNVPTHNAISRAMCRRQIPAGITSGLAHMFARKIFLGVNMKSAQVDSDTSEVLSLAVDLLHGLPCFPLQNILATACSFVVQILI